jgi:hypothetical protein
MIATDDNRPGYPSHLADLRQVPFMDMPAPSDEVLRRLVPALLTRRSRRRVHFAYLTQERPS